VLTVQYAGRDILLIAVIGTAAAAGVAFWFGWWGVLPVFLALALLAFYRDPARQASPAADVVLAPADGRVVEITHDAAVPGEAGRFLRIMIFLSVFDVHVNRSPCAGTVRETAYAPGRFLSALNPVADAENESNRIILEPKPPLPGSVHVRQIAGILARRIVCRVRTGTALTAGERVGMIKLGSRTELCLPQPDAWQVCVRHGQHVSAGRTVVARWKPAAPADALSAAAEH
jgi:phosphatidylserine decarboxylase